MPSVHLNVTKTILLCRANGKIVFRKCDNFQASDVIGFKGCNTRFLYKKHLFKKLWAENSQS